MCSNTLCFYTSDRSLRAWGIGAGARLAMTRWLTGIKQDLCRKTLYFYIFWGCDRTVSTLASDRVLVFAGIRMEFGPRLPWGMDNLTSDSLHGLCWLRRFVRCFNTLFFHVVWQLVVPTRQHVRQANHDSLGHRNIHKKQEVGARRPGEDRASGPRAHEPGEKVLSCPGRAGR